MSFSSCQFKFVPAIGGLANDGDALVLSLPAPSIAEAAAICAALGLPLQPALPDEPQPELGRPYRAEEIARFRSLTHGDPRYVQPCYVQVAGEPCFVWVDLQSVSVTVAGADGDPYRVTEADWQRAARIEAWLRGRAG